MNPNPPTSGAVETTRQGGKYRLLHRMYFLGSGVSHFVTRRMKPAGTALGLIFVLATFLGVGHDKSSVYQLFSLTAAFLVMGLPWAFSRQGKVEAVRDLPRYATAGQTLRYPVVVTNVGRRKLTRAWLEESMPDARPTLEEFSRMKEPGEDERNGFDRRLAYFRWRWLHLRRRAFTGGTSQGSLQLAPGATARVAVEIKPLRRGVIQLDDLRVLLPDPFGLFQRVRRVPAPTSLLTVLPVRHPLPPIRLAGGAAFKVSGEANTNTIGSSGEFVGLRDYRPGDPLRQIHWKSWARTGRPIVKELEDTFYPRFGLIVDTLHEDATDERFEAVISVASSFAASIDTRESLLDLMFIKNEAHMVTAGRGLERVERLLDVLAGVSPELTAGYDALAQLVIKHREDLSSCLVVFNGWDAERAAFLNRLVRNRILCAPLVVGSGDPPPGVPGHWLRTEHLAADLLALPHHLTTAL